MILSLVGGTDLTPARSGVAVIIPARFASTRFPGKPLVPLKGVDGTAKSLLQRTWEVARTVEGVTDIRIATDDLRIAESAAAFGAEFVLTTDCRNGTERCWRAVETAGIAADIVVNLQGDAPLTPPVAIEALVKAMRSDERILVATPMIRCTPATLDRLRADAHAGRVGGTTVVFDYALNALYFSKRLIPYAPPYADDTPVYLHVGLYAYRRAVLADYALIDPPDMERVEGLEQLRFLHAGIAIRMVEIADPPGGLWEVNNPADIGMVEAALAIRKIA